MRLTRDMVIKAIEIARPTIMEIISASLSSPEKEGVSIVVMHGTFEGRGINTNEPLLEVAYQVGISDDKCDDFAMRKAKLSWRTGADSMEIVKDFYSILLLEEDQDCVYGGSHTFNIGNIRLVVSTSGIKECEDQTISMIVENIILMLMNQRVVSAPQSNHGIIA